MLIEFKVEIELSVIRFLRLLLERLEQVSDAVSGECRLAKDAHDFKISGVGSPDHFLLHHLLSVLYIHPMLRLRIQATALKINNRRSCGCTYRLRGANTCYYERIIVIIINYWNRYCIVCIWHI